MLLKLIDRYQLLLNSPPARAARRSSKQLRAKLAGRRGLIIAVRKAARTLLR